MTPTLGLGSPLVAVKGVGPAGATFTLILSDSDSPKMVSATPSSQLVRPAVVSLQPGSVS